MAISRLQHKRQGKSQHCDRAMGRQAVFFNLRKINHQRYGGLWQRVGPQYSYPPCFDQPSNRSRGAPGNQSVRRSSNFGLVIRDQPRAQCQHLQGQ